MQAIHSFNDLIAHLRLQERRYRLAVVCGTDDSTLQAVARAVNDGFAEAYFVGHTLEVKQKLSATKISEARMHFVNADTDEAAAQEAVMMVGRGEADVLVKGLIHTDTLLRAVLNKEWGILPRGRVLTHIAVAEMKSYHKLLFFSDAAVIPYPTHEQRLQQVGYLAHVLHAFGIEEPRISLVHCTETVSPKFPHTEGYAEICQRAISGEWGRLRVDGPLDLRTSCDPLTLRVKGIDSPLEGDADALVLPDIESGNALYKALSLFAGAQVAGMLQGTIVPVVLPSRGDDADAKYFSLALATLASSINSQN